MHKIIKIGSLLLLFSFLLGCQTKFDSPELIVTKHLQRKYDQEFQIQHVENQNIGQNFAKYITVGEASPADSPNETFSFTMYEDGTITDNYPMLLFEEQINQDVISIFTSGNLEFSNIDVKFPETDQTYISFSDYKQNFNAFIYADLKSTDSNSDSAVQEAYRLLTALKDNGYYFDVTVEIADKQKIFIFDNNIEMISKDAFIKKF